MLAQLVAILLTFPTAVFTVALGVALLYWLFVIIGAAHIDIGGDGAADGALDGVGGHGEIGDVGGHADVGGHDVGGHADAGGHGDAGGHDGGDGGDGGDTDGDHAHAGSGAHGLLAALKLRSAPLTVVLSVLVLFAWLFSMLGAQLAIAWLPVGLVGIARVAVFVLSPVLALPLTSLAVRPLARVFVPTIAVAKRDLVGKICVVRTGTVTDRFGEGLLEDGGAGVVVRIRVDTGESIKRGDQVVITDYDADKQEFTVAPMENLLAERTRR